MRAFPETMSFPNAVMFMTASCVYIMMMLNSRSFARDVHALKACAHQGAV